MKRIEVMAYDWADEHCRCSDDEADGYCEAGGMQKGYEAGFRAAREMASAMIARAGHNPRYAGMAVEYAMAAIAADLRALGEDESE